MTQVHRLNPEPKTPLLQLAEMGQSVWLDSLRRGLIRNGELRRLIEEDGLMGMTSNPSIFEKAISGSAEYDSQIKTLLSERDWDIKELYEALAVQDIRDAADVFRPVYDRTHAIDGYVSLEVSPYLARDAAGTIEEARRLWRSLDRQNVMIKVPGTSECVPAIQQLVSEGININITLLFSQDRYEEVAEAYISGLEKYVASSEKNKRDLSRIASVASFFVSRIDALADTLIEDQIRSSSDEERKENLKKIKGRLAIANAKMAYQRYLRIFGTDRWHKLAAQGARPQRLLWASTSVKNPAYRDVMYVEELVGSETVTTVPPSTFAAFRDHGQVSETLTQELDQARWDLKTLEDAKISLHDITEMLTAEAIELFSDPFDKLLGTLEKKRRGLLGSRMNTFSYEIPSEMNLIVAEHLKHWADSGSVRLFWRQDPKLWTQKDESHWMGWLDIAQRTLKDIDEVLAFANEVRNDGIRHVLLLGMGGSSLAPELFANIFSEHEGFPKLQIVDSTHPDQIRDIENSVDLSQTLVIVSSKSGTTLESQILYEYFRSKITDALGSASEEVGQRFIAITDPGSPLEQQAKAAGFRRVFLGVPEIGGRYSALSHFGIVPAALAGVDVRAVLERALLMAQSCSCWTPPKENPGIHLGIALGVLANHGRNKITLISSKLGALELWLEQLLAESTGKQGKGLIPISGEELSVVEAYGADRVFVYLKQESLAGTEWDRKVEEKLIRLQESGQPVFRILIRDLENIGQEFFRWEVATAVIGSVLRINPFDQPDVEASKIAARTLMKKFEETGSIPRENLILEKTNDANIKLYASSQVVQKLHLNEPVLNLNLVLRHFFQLLREGNYFAILAYFPMEKEVVKELEDLRLMVRNHMRVATTVQFGPRFLHSTGQAFKGGPNQGAFLLIDDETITDLPVPGKKYTFSTVVHAQALGDLQVLVERERRVIHLQIGKDRLAGLRDLNVAFRHALHGVTPLNNQVNTEGINREFRLNRDRKVGGSA